MWTLYVEAIPQGVKMPAGFDRGRSPPRRRDDEPGPHAPSGPPDRADDRGADPRPWGPSPPGSSGPRARWNDPRRSARSWFPPTTDPVSTVYYALADGRYSTVLATVYERLDRAVERRYHVVIGQIPWRNPERVGVPGASGLRRASRKVRAVYAEALQRESPFWFRWAFWRRAEADENLFLARVDDAIRVSADWISTLEGTP